MHDGSLRVCVDYISFLHSVFGSVFCVTIYDVPPDALLFAILFPGS